MVVASGNSATTQQAPDSNHNLLINNHLYKIQIRAHDNAGNVGPCSNPVTGTPQVIDDFWRLYKKDGGSDSGGCSQPGAGMTALAVLGALALLARARKRNAP